MIRDHQLKIYNSHSAKKEIFKPLSPPLVGMYVCGPTVYSYVHLGNIRTFLSFDLVYRYLMHLGYKVRYVRNITDVGHLVEEEEEDKIAKRAKLEELEPMEIVMKYTHDFHSMASRFNLLPPSIEPTATGHLIEQIELIRKMIDKGLAYEKDGSVYFDVVKYNEVENYGELSKRNIEELFSLTRELAGQTGKKNPQDFALWKKASPQHIMRWPSPWSDGFPGWHLECTAMSTKYLGEQFDIHGGGIDLKFPHHECEIAQAKACFNKEPVQYWMHANMLTLNGQKMSKSTGNTLLPADLLSGNNSFFEKPIDPMVLRFFMLQAHYRSTLDMSNDAVMAAEKAYKKLMRSVVDLNKIKSYGERSDFPVKKWIEECYTAMDDDFNSPILIAKLFEAVKFITAWKEGKQTLTIQDAELFKEKIGHFVFDVLGLLDTQNEEKHEQKYLDNTMQLLLDLRKQAREDRNWALTDKIRDELAKTGIVLHDGKDGTSYSIKG